MVVRGSVVSLSATLITHCWVDGAVYETLNISRTLQPENGEHTVTIVQL